MVSQAGTKKILLMLSLCRVSGITQGYKSKSSTYRSMHWRFQSYPKIISCQTYCIDDWLVSNNIFMFACAIDYSLIIACKGTSKIWNTQKNFCFFVVFCFRARNLHSFGTYCLIRRKLLHILLDAFYADNILAFDPSGIVIDNCFVYCFSFYIENRISSKKLRCRF